MVYGYTGIVPAALWAVLKWYGSESANLLECLCLYGYSNLIWIPVALISWSPISSKLPHASACCAPYVWRIQSANTSFTSPQLCLCSRRLRCIGFLPPPQPLSNPELYRSEDIQDPAHCRTCTTCRILHRYKSPLLCRDEPCRTKGWSKQRWRWRRPER